MIHLQQLKKENPNVEESPPLPPPLTAAVAAATASVPEAGPLPENLEQSSETSPPVVPTNLTEGTSQKGLAPVMVHQFASQLPRCTIINGYGTTNQWPVHLQDLKSTCQCTGREFTPGCDFDLASRSFRRDGTSEIVLQTQSRLFKKTLSLNSQKQKRFTMEAVARLTNTIIFDKSPSILI